MKNFKKIIYPVVFSGFCAISLLVQAAAVDELVAAVIRDSDIAVREQIKRGTDLNARDAKGQTALTMAIHYQSEKALPVLLQASKIDINATNAAGESPLMLAIITDQNDLARSLIKRGAAINKEGWTPLHYAATKGNLEIIRLLLSKDAYIDAESPNETTPLMMAAQYGNESAVLLLLQRGADPWGRNQIKLNPLDFARKGGNAESIRYIQTAQSRRKPVYSAKPLTPLSPASAAELKGEPIPENPEEPEMYYPEGMEPPAKPASAASAG